MTQTSIRRTPNLLVGLAVGLAIAIGAALSLPAALAQAPGTTTWLGADSNVEAAVALSQATYDVALTAFLARDDDFADALASGGPQGRLQGPLLLTDSQSLSSQTLEELQRLLTRTVFILGGVDAVSQAVEDALVSEGIIVQRVAGDTRLTTATAIAGQFFPEAQSALLLRAFGPPAGSDGDPTQGFADSLAAGGFAAAEGQPILLTDSNVLSQPTREYLESSAISEVTIIGGEAAVSGAVELMLTEELDLDVTRIGGANRFATAANVAAERGPANAGDAPAVLLIEGQADNAFASGFAAASLSANSDAPIVLANGAGLPIETSVYLDPANGEPGLVCGPLTTQTACDQAASAAGNPPVDCSGTSQGRPRPDEPCGSGEGDVELPLPTEDPLPTDTALPTEPLSTETPLPTVSPTLSS